MDGVIPDMLVYLIGLFLLAVAFGVMLFLDVGFGLIIFLMYFLVWGLFVLKARSTISKEQMEIMQAEHDVRGKKFRIFSRRILVYALAPFLSVLLLLIAWVKVHFRL